MPKLSISCADWIRAASYGELDQLERWYRSGALDIRYDPVRVGVSGGQGRARIFDVCDAEKRTALYAAISSGQVDYALRLLELGKFPATKTREGRTAMHAAALLYKGADRVIPALVAQGHPVDVADKKGMTPLLLAVYRNRDEADTMLLVVKALIAAGASPNPLDGGEHPLERLVSRGLEHIVAGLLEAGANPNAPLGRFDASPLHMLAANWDREDDQDPENSPRVRILRMLLAAGADPEAVINENGQPLSVEKAFYTQKGKELFLGMVAENNARALSQATAPVMGSGKGLRL